MRTRQNVRVSDPRRRTAARSAAVVVLLALLGAGGWQAVAAGGAAPRVDPREAPYYDPAHFTTRIDNAWFPLKPGITYVYRGVETDGHTRDVFTVTRQTITIAGVECRVVHDEVFLDGVLQETTRDYYTQDVDGNVWYFGEDTAELDKNGHVTSREGTWRTGRDGAEAGIFMEANPQVGHTFQQEFLRGHAEDHLQMLSLTKEVQVPYGHFGRNPLRQSVLLTKEWTPLEPRIIDHKYYVRGIGEVRETTVKGPLETLSLVRIVER
jgi:hypothetical protein